MKKFKKSSSKVSNDKKCPQCGSKLVLEEIDRWVCSNNKKCGFYAEVYDV